MAYKFDKKGFLVLMAKADLNRGQLAEKAGISKPTLTAVINGRGAHVESYAKLAMALNVEPIEVFRLMSFDESEAI